MAGNVPNNLDAFSITLVGWDELIDRMKAAPQQIQDDLEGIVLNRAESIVSEAKQRAPKNLGRLAGSGHSVPGPNPLSVGVSFDVDYAAYVEFGTGTHVDVPSEPDGIEEYALTFKGTHDIPGMAARPFLFPAVARQTPIFIKEVTDVLNSAIND